MALSLCTHRVCFHNGERPRAALLPPPHSPCLGTVGPPAAFASSQRATGCRRDDGFITNEKLSKRRSVRGWMELVATQQRPTAMRVSGSARICLNAPRRGAQQMVDMCDISASQSSLVSSSCTLTRTSHFLTNDSLVMTSVFVK